MKKTVFMLAIILLLEMISFGYVHIFSYRDFIDYEVGEEITSSVLHSNDDGSHGSNDYWGSNKELTWPDVSGDTNVYLSSDLPPIILAKEDEQALFLSGKSDKKAIIGLVDVPNPLEKYILFTYEFYLEKKDDKDSGIVLFSNKKPGEIGRIFFVYENGTLKVFRKTGRYSEQLLFEKKIDLYNKWYKFALKIIKREIIITIGTRRHYSEKFNDDFSIIPFYYAGNWIRTNELSDMNVYFKNFVVAHGK